MSKSQQNYLDQVAQRLHLTVDAQSGILFGMQGGLHMMLMRSTSNQNFVSLVFSLTHSGQEPDAAEIKAFVKSNKLIVNYSIRRSRVEFILKPRFGSFKQIDQLEQVTGEVVSLLRTGGYQSCCQNCGQTADTDACIMAGFRPCCVTAAISSWAIIRNRFSRNLPASRRMCWPVWWALYWDACWAWAALCCWDSWAM